MKTCNKCNTVTLNDGDEYCRECSCTEFTEYVEPEGEELDALVNDILRRNGFFVDQGCSPSTTWGHGGPIITECWDEITDELYRMFPREFPESHDWWQQLDGKDFLKVAMQAFVRVNNKEFRG